MKQLLCQPIRPESAIFQEVVAEIHPKLRAKASIIF